MPQKKKCTEADNVEESPLRISANSFVGGEAVNRFAASSSAI
jgi:hypothetical protein